MTSTEPVGAIRPSDRRRRRFLDLDTSRGIAGRRPEIDGLRAVAVIAVFFFHAYPGWFFWAWSGVDLFFVLSGFLITGILLRGRGPTTEVLRSFYARRVLRIWPVYYLGLVAATLLALARGLHVSVGAVLASMFFVQFTSLYAGFKATTQVIAEYVPLFSHSWSVAVEEQFYVVWPGAVLLCRRRPQLLVSLCGLLVVLGVASRAAHIAPYLLLTRIDGLALGAVLAMLVHGRRAAEPGEVRSVSRLSWAALAVGSPVVAWYGANGYLHHERLTPESNHLNALVVLGFAAFFLGVVGLLLSGRLRLLQAVLSRPLLVYVGGLSYAIYMFHTMVLFVVQRAADRIHLSANLANLLALPAVVAVAHVSMRFVEGPVLRLKSRFPIPGAAEA